MSQGPEWLEEALDTLRDDRTGKEHGYAVLFCQAQPQWQGFFYHDLEAANRAADSHRRFGYETQGPMELHYDDPEEIQRTLRRLEEEAAEGILAERDL